MRTIIIVASAALVAACATTTTPGPTTPKTAAAARIVSAGCGSMGAPGAFMLQMQAKGSDLQARIAKAAQSPVGSAQNPVRVCNPSGQQAYLRQLRCTDGSAPTFSRLGNGGGGLYGSIIDIYRVVCTQGEPRERQIIMDMYFPTNQTMEPPPGYSVGR